MKDTLKHLVALLVLLGGGFLAYYIAQNFNFATATEKAKQARLRTEELQGEVLSDIKKLENISLDNGIIALPAYTALVDRTPILRYSNVGAKEPFEPQQKPEEKNTKKK